jgi:hypothetical protein
MKLYTGNGAGRLVGSGKRNVDPRRTLGQLQAHRRRRHTVTATSTSAGIDATTTSSSHGNGAASSSAPAARCGILGGHWAGFKHIV